MLTIEKHIPIKSIEIWSPRYHDDVCLIAKKKVADHNLIWFSRAKSLKGKEFYISKEKIKGCPLETNGAIPCYAVPMSLLQEMTRERDIW